MPRATHPRLFSSLYTAATLVILLLVTALILMSIDPAVYAEGSRNLINNAGSRAYLEYHETATTGGIPRRTTILVYAEAGERLNLGSSAMNIRNDPLRLDWGNIEVVSPDGSIDTTCEDRRIAVGGTVAEYGVIRNLAEENAGPEPDNGPNEGPDVAGYEPCTFDVTAGTAGMWTVRFISPNPSNNINNNPPQRLTTAEWAPQPATSYWIAAWDVTVTEIATDAAIPGRAFTTYLALNLGANGPRLRTEVYILTIDGYIYRVNTNGLDPFGFIFFANTEGFTDRVTGQPVYRSVQFQGSNTNPILPAPYRLHSPADEDIIPSNDVTQLIFFEEPDPNLPETTTFYDEVNNVVASTWLRAITPIAPPTVTNFSFTGTEGTPNQMGTSPLGGYFRFNSTRVGGVSITVDVNGDGNFGPLPDRILTVGVTVGSNEIFWDGLNGNGAPVVPGTIPFAARVIGHYGEVHFPIFDAERNLDGISIERIRDAGTTTLGNLDPYLVYYNDAYTYNGSNIYDFTLCAAGETPAPPIPATPPTAAPYCFGTPPNPRSALDGVNSEVAPPGDITGAHAWGSSGGDFGDRRGIDTWVFYPSDPINLAVGIDVREADLEIVKSHQPTVLLPGGPITYTLVVTNNGPSDAQGATVRDIIPGQVTNVTWSCQITSGTGACGAASGSGNVISTTVDLDDQAVATYTIRGTLSANAAGTLANTAYVDRPPDLNDPNPNNNRWPDNATISPAADLELEKSIVAPLPTGLGQPLVFQITLRNRGPATADNVTVRDQLPAEVTYVSSVASRGSYDPATGIWTVGSIARDEVLTLRITTTLNAPTAQNVAQVNTSSVPDPDSTPGNNNPNEDDQTTTGVPIPLADVSLTKTVNTPQVNVGQNVVFSVVVRNDGPDTATGVEVSDRLPSGLTYVSHGQSQGLYNPASGVWDIGTLLLNNTATLTIEATVTGTGPFTNTAEVSDMNEFDLDSTPNNNNPNEDDQDSATVQAVLADLALTKTVNNFQPLLGEIITYTITLRNDGPSNASGVTVQEQTPPGLLYLSHTTSPGTTYNPLTGIWVVGALPAGGNVTLTLTAQVTSNSPVTNLAQVSTSDQPDPDSIPSNGNPNEDDQASVTVPNVPVDLALSKTIVGQPPTQIGDTVTFNVQVVNQGSTTATGIQVTDRLPGGLAYVSHTVSQGSYDPVSGLWVIGTLAPAATADLLVVARVTSSGTLVNVAEISRCDQPDIDSTPNNNNPLEDDIGLRPVTIIPAAIVLLNFNATWRAGGAIELSWQTGLELNTAGFHLYRSTDGTRAGAVRITPALIAAQGSASGGTSYRFIDGNVAPGKNYSYWLREVEAGGMISEYGPVRPGPRLNAGGNRAYLPLIWR